MGDHSKYASGAVAELLHANGIRRLEDAFRVGGAVDAEHLRRATRHDNKGVVRLNMNAPGGVMTVYIKRQWRRERWIPRPTDFRHRIGLLCSPVHEWHGLRVLQSAGFHVSEPLALFYRGWGLVRGAVVTRGVPASASLADMLLNGTLQKMSLASRNTLLEEAARIAAQMHRQRIAWRSMKAKHFYPEELSGGHWRIWLIDCEGVYRRASWRDCRREWTTFVRYFSTHTPAFKAVLEAAYQRVLTSDTPSVRLKPAA